MYIVFIIVQVLFKLDRERERERERERGEENESDCHIQNMYDFSIHVMPI